MNALITITDIQLFKGISSNVNIAKDLNPHILEAQNFDLRPFLGESFYLAVHSNPAAYATLMNGTTYTYNGSQYEHEGLRAILVYHSVARFISHSGIISTPTGMVQKMNQYSEPVNDKSIARLVQQARAGATTHEDRVRLFLDRNTALYPLWKCSTNENYKVGLKSRKI